MQNAQRMMDSMSNKRDQAAITSDYQCTQSIKQHQLRHEAVLRQALDAADIPAKKLKDALAYVLFPGGKRFRPLLVYASGTLLEAPLPCLDVIAAAIEIMHCYSLVHDDLPAMDNDSLRRGKPTCHLAFDEATAILIGDGMQAMAIDLLLTQLPKHLPFSKVIRITQLLMKACGLSGMVSGQSLDLSELSQSHINEPRLRIIHELKTGRLISACIDMVLATLEPEPETADALRDFAREIGLVFQMQDDYLDRYGEVTALGKGRSSDAANQKTTFATLYSQPMLRDQITHHFKLAHTALNPFKMRANELHQLINSLQRLGTLTDVPKEFIDNPALLKAMELAQEAAYTPAELEAYDRYWDAVRVEKTFRKDAREQGREEGRIDERIKIIKQLLVTGMTENQVAQVLQLSIESIQKMIKS